MVWNILSFQGSYIIVRLTLIYFFVLKNLLKNWIKDSMVWPFFFFFKLSSKFLLKVYAFFSVSKVFKKFELQTIWFNLYCHLENIDQFLSKGHIANSDQHKIRIQPYCPFKDSTYISIETSWNIEIFLKNF